MVSCDTKIPFKLKRKLLSNCGKTCDVVRDWSLCGYKNHHKNKVSVVEIMMLHWMCGNTKHDKIRNDNIRESVGVKSIVEKMMGTIFRWF